MTLPRPEFPDPQFQRKDWINLNGEWEFRYDNELSGEEKEYFKADTEFDKKITVPFCPESKLSGIGNVDFIYGVWYRRTVEIPEKYQSKRVVLHFGACDYKTRVWIDGEFVGEHKGGYLSFFFDITKYINKNSITITVFAKDDTRDPMQPRGKQCEKFHSCGCDYTRTTGIWQTVWLEATEKEYIKSFKFYPNAENGSLDIQGVVVGDGKFEAVAYYENKIMGAASAVSHGGTVNLHLDLKEKHLWSVGDGKLYDIELRFCGDTVNSYFGLRSVKIEDMKFKLNNETVFQRLVLDQGFYPDGIYTAPTEEDLIKDIQLSIDAGFNGARLHQKVFEPRFLYHCDKMGYIVWGEYGNWGVDHSQPESVYSFLPEWMSEIERDFNHPSIIGWCPFNETWDIAGRKQYDDLLAVVYDVTKAMDTTRPCIDTSGNYHVKTDIFDIHDYEQDTRLFKERFDKLMSEGTLFDNHRARQHYNGEPTFISEYGGIKVNDGSTDSWGYGDDARDEAEVIARYKGLTEAILNNNKMLGFCYTQLYDIEQEQNGLYKYDRTPKYDISRFKEINTQKAAIED